MSSVVGQDWRPKTMKELVVMYHAKLLESWDHTSHIVAKIHNANSRKGSTKETRFFHPYKRDENKVPITPQTIHNLKILAET